jgi:hypothetical protein
MTSYFKEKRLTGNRRHRAGWKGTLILQVECEGDWVSDLGAFVDSEPGTVLWRDARIEDLTEGV